MDIPKSKKLEIIIPAYRMHTQSFDNVIKDITEDAALRRIDYKTNHIIWMVGNIVNVRYSLGWILGLKEEDPNSHLFYMGKGWNPDFDYPTLETLKKNFHDISPKVYQRLLEVTDEELAEEFSIGMSIDFIKEDKLNFTGMSIGREDYLFGQLGLMRKLLDYPGMGYDINKELKY